MNRLLKATVYTVLLGPVLLSASCAQKTALLSAQQYPGPKRPRGEIAILRCAKHINVMRVDGERPSFVSAPGCRIEGSEIELLPGTHTIQVEYKISEHLYGKVYVQTTEDNLTLRFAAKAGHVYWISPSFWQDGQPTTLPGAFDLYRGKRFVWRADGSIGMTDLGGDILCQMKILDTTGQEVVPWDDGQLEIDPDSYAGRIKTKRELQMKVDRPIVEKVIGASLPESSIFWAARSKDLGKGVLLYLVTIDIPMAALRGLLDNSHNLPSLSELKRNHSVAQEIREAYDEILGGHGSRPLSLEKGRYGMKDIGTRITLVGSEYCKFQCRISVCVGLEHDGEVRVYVLMRYEQVP